MSRRLKYFLLPVAGAFAAILSFVLAWPHMQELLRPELAKGDPSALTTFGTKFGLIQHITMGSTLCGLFCFILELGRRKASTVLRVTLTGVIVGGTLTTCANLLSDYLGLSMSRASGSLSGSLFSVVAWLLLVPASYAFSIAISLGPTKERLRRALISAMIAIPVALVAYVITSIIAVPLMMAQVNSASSQLGGFSGTDFDAMARNTTSMAWKAAVQVWAATEIANGIIIGLTTFIADRAIRKASVRQLVGHREHRDWTLDYPANRIGSGEVEIQVRGYQGVEPVHACIFLQGHQFMFDAQYAPAFVNGYPVSQAYLNHGDQIQVGDAILFFVVGKQSLQPPNHHIPIYHAPPSYQTPVYEVPPTAVPVAVQPVQVAVTKAFIVDLGGSKFELPLGETSVGRDVGNALCLANSSTVSRHHAVIVFDGSSVQVIDKGSSNGTWVNKIRQTTPVTVQTGDQVAFGSAQYSVEIGPE